MSDDLHIILCITQFLTFGNADLISHDVGERHHLRRIVAGDDEARALVVADLGGQILDADLYDANGKIWRVGESYGINYYDVPTYWSMLDAYYDLANRRYTAIGFDNKERMYDFSVHLTPDDFSISALRSVGVR